MTEAPRRVAIVTGIYPPDIGGPATHVADLQARFSADGRPCTVLTLGDVAAVEEDSGVVRVPRTWPWPFRFAAVALWLRRNASRFDVVYATGLQPAAVIGAHLARRPVAVKIVGDPAWERGRRRGLTTKGFDAFQAEPGPNLGVRAMRWVRDRSLRDADAIVAPSKTLAATISGWLSGPVDVRVVPNGAVKQRVVKTGRHSALQLASVGRLVAHKRLDRLIDAVAGLADVGLTIVGEGPERADLERQINRVHADGQVSMSGSLDHEATIDVIANADALVLASDYEGLPHVAVEAVVHGTPIVGPPVGGTAELLRDGETGIVVADASVDGFKKAFVELRDNADLRKILRKGAVSEGRRWTFDHVADLLAELLDGLDRRPRVVFLGKTILPDPLPADLETKVGLLGERFDPRLVNVGVPAVRPIGRAVAYVFPSFKPPLVSGLLFYGLAPILALALGARRRPSAIVCQSPFEAAPLLGLSKMLPRSIRPGIVVEVHGDWRSATRLYGSPSRRLLSPIADRIASEAVRTADRVRVIGPYTERLVEETGFRGTVDMSMAFNDLDSFLDPRVVPLPSGPRALFVGVLERYKGVDVLLDAWANVLDAVPNAELVIVGEGSIGAALQRRVHRSDRLGRVSFIGWLPRAEIVQQMDAATVLVLPSRSEGMGLVTIEAMARARAVVASRVGGIPDIVRDGSTGLLVEPEDPESLAEAISSVLSNQDLAAKLGDEGRTVAEGLGGPTSFSAGLDRLRAWIAAR